jgi:hypothetical protein
MRFMIIVKGTDESEAGAMPEDSMFAVMADYHEQLAKAGVLVDASGLQPTSKGFRIRWRGGDKTVLDGPFTESKEVFAGYTTIRVASRQEALDWAEKFPNPVGPGRDAEIEVRQMFDLDDFEPSPSVERFRAMDLEQGKSG